MKENIAKRNTKKKRVPRAPVLSALRRRFIN